MDSTHFMTLGVINQEKEQNYNNNENEKEKFVFPLDITLNMQNFTVLCPCSCPVCRPGVLVLVLVPATCFTNEVLGCHSPFEKVRENKNKKQARTL